MSKRVGGKAAAATAKRAKNDPVEQKLSTVADALKGVEEDVSTAGLEMMLGALPLSLGVAADARHPLQQEMAEAIDRVVQEASVALAATAQERKDNVAIAQAKQEEAQKALAAATASLESAHAGFEEQKQVLATVATTYQAAKGELKRIEGEEVLGLQEIEMAAEHRTDLERLAQLVGSTPAEASTLVKGLDTHLSLENSLRSALPTALHKEPSDRGAFDRMVVTQLEQQLQEKIAAKGALLEEAAPKKAALQSQTAMAAEAFQAASKDQRARAETFKAAREAEAKCQEALATAQNEAKTATRGARAAVGEADVAQAEVELFADGPLQAMSFLMNRTTPPPPPPIEVAPEVPEEAAGTAPAAAKEPVELPLPVEEQAGA